MKVRQYKLRFYPNGERCIEKTCWLDKLDLEVGNRVTLDDYPDSMWWNVVEKYDIIAEAEQVNFIKPKEEDTIGGAYWIPM